MSVAELAERIGARVVGDGSVRVSGCAGIEEAGPWEVTFVANHRYVRLLGETGAGAVIVSPGEAERAPGRTLLVSEHPYLAFREAVVALHGYREHPGGGVSDRAEIDPSAEVGRGCTIHALACVAAGARVGERCVIYPHCYVGPGAVVGDGCVLFPNVTVYDGCVLGDRVTLHAGCVIGQDGFGYVPHDGRNLKIPQAGNVVVEDDVELGAGCVVDRATVGSTRIGRGTKMSDLVAIGHGAEIGKHNLFVAQVGIAGSTRTGDYVVMGGQAGVAGHLKIADGVQLAAKTGVIDDLSEKGQQYGGQPALPLSHTKRNVLALAKLPKLMQEFKRVKKRLEALERELAGAGGGSLSEGEVDQGRGADLGEGSGRSAATVNVEVSGVSSFKRAERAAASRTNE